MHTFALQDIGQVRWSHDAVYDHFKDGTSVFETVVELLSGKLKLLDLPPLQLVKKGGQYYSLSNRRLYAIRQYAQILKQFGRLHEKTSLSVPVSFAESYSGEAFTSVTGGLRVELIRPLQGPSFPLRNVGPRRPPSARSLSRDALSHSKERNRSLSRGRWVEPDPQGRRRISFGQTDWRFILTECDEPSGVRERRPSPAPRTRMGHPEQPKESPAQPTVKETPAQPKATPKAKETPIQTNAKETPAQQPKVKETPAEPKALPEEESQSKAKKAKKNKSKDPSLPTSTEEVLSAARQTKMDAASEKGKEATPLTSEGYPTLPSCKRTKTETEVGELVLLCLGLQRAVPKPRQAVPRPEIRDLLAKLAPGGEDSKVQSWLGGSGYSLGHQSYYEKLLPSLRQLVERLTTQLADTQRVGCQQWEDSADAP
ncbi:unnamed protein product, partial [Symbiodinium sp. CCMP2456]